jgi:alcohol dehydrogenase (NADP+)
MKNLLFMNGDKLPSIGLGTWLSKKNEVYDAVVEAIRVGYRHIDCAYIYQNEKEIGQAIQFSIKSGWVKREDLFITSKLWNSDHSPERVNVAIRRSLKDLQLDYLDLYLIHWPVAFKTGHEQAKDVSDLLTPDEIPILTTWQAMEKTKNSGLTKHIGVSNFNIHKLQKLINEAGIKPELNQVELHPYFQQPELIDFCHINEILVTAYSPLGSRHLVQSEAGLTREKNIVEISLKYSCSPAQVLLAWGMARGIAVIPKSVHPIRIQENFESLNIQLSDEDIKQINSLECNLRIAKGLFCVIPGGPYTLRNIWNE